MKSIFRLIFLCLLVLPPSVSAAEKGLTVKGARYFSYSLFTRIVFEIESAAPYIVNRSADGRSLLLSAYDGPLQLKTSLPVINDGVVGAVESREEAGRIFIVVHLAAQTGEVKDFVLRGPDRIVLDIAKANTAPPSPAADKQLVVLLDPGHGGKDPGIVTAQGLEKAFDLDVASAVKKSLQSDPRLKVVLTREKDTTLGLDDRAAAANRAGASVFVSLHSAPGAGVRVYVEDAEDEASRAGLRPASGNYLDFEAGSEQQERLWDRQQAAHMKESAVLGRAIARQLNGTEPVQAPMAGLKPVDAAAVLVEIGAEQDRARTAGAVAKGIEQYVRENR